MSAPTTVQWLRAAVHRIAVGSGRRATALTAAAMRCARSIWASARAWLDEGTGLGWLLRAGVLVVIAAIARKVGAAIALAVYHRVAGGGAPFVCWGAAVWWIVSAYRAGADGWEPKRRSRQAAEEEQPGPVEAVAEEEPRPGAEQPPAGPPRPSLADLRSALARVGTPHAHIAVLAADLGTTPDRVREALDQWQILVEPVRMRGRGSSTGIKSDALPDPGAAQESVVAAGQPGNNDNNNADSTPTEEGLRVEDIGQGGRVVRDPADTLRHHSLNDPRAG